MTDSFALGAKPVSYSSTIIKKNPDGTMAPLDISGASNVYMEFKKQNGTRFSKPATKSGNVITYTNLATDESILDDPGKWLRRPVATYADGSYFASYDWIVFIVTP